MITQNTLFFAVAPAELAERLARSRRVLHPADALPRLFGVRSTRTGGEWADATADPASCLDAAAELEARGEVEVWEHPKRGPVVVLSPAAAERAGVELSGDGLRWRPRGKATRPTKVKRRHDLRHDLEGARLDPSDARGMTVVEVKARERKAACGAGRMAFWFSVGRAGFWTLHPRPGARHILGGWEVVLAGGCRDSGARVYGGGEV